jgi:hypothetical protein
LRKRYGLTVENTVSKVKEHFSEPVETATVSELPAAI